MDASELTTVSRYDFRLSSGSRLVAHIQDHGLVIVREVGDQLQLSTHRFDEGAQGGEHEVRLVFDARDLGLGDLERPRQAGPCVNRRARRSWDRDASWAASSSSRRCAARRRRSGASGRASRRSVSSENGRVDIVRFLLVTRCSFQVRLVQPGQT